jgi:hypothetical protein
VRFGSEKTERCEQRYGEKVVDFMLDDYKFFKEATQECKTEK